MTPAGSPTSGSREPPPTADGPTLQGTSLPASPSALGGCIWWLLGSHVFSSTLSLSQAHWPLSRKSLAKHLKIEAHLLSYQLGAALAEQIKPTARFPSFLH